MGTTTPPPRSRSTCAPAERLSLRERPFSLVHQGYLLSGSLRPVELTVEAFHHISSLQAAHFVALPMPSVLHRASEAPDITRQVACRAASSRVGTSGTSALKEHFHLFRHQKVKSHGFHGQFLPRTTGNQMDLHSISAIISKARALQSHVRECAALRPL